VSGVDPAARPVLARGLRLQWEAAQNAHVLLYPEGMIKLNASAAAIITRCDGRRTIAEVVSDLEREYSASNLGPDVAAFLAMALERRWLEIAP